MIQAPGLTAARHGVLLGAALLLGLGLAAATTGLSWQSGAGGLGLALAALVGLAQTCSA